MPWLADSIVELRVGYLANDQQCFNVYHFDPTGDSTGFDRPTLLKNFVDRQCINVAGHLVFELKKVLGSNVHINKVVGQLVYPQRERAYGVDLFITGTQANACNAQNVQWTVTKYGDLANKRNIGSVHIGGMPDDAFDGGQMSAAFALAAAGFKSNWLVVDQSDGTSAAVYKQTILNRDVIIVGGKKRYPIIGDQLVTAWNIRTELRTQRTRTVGRGI